MSCINCSSINTESEQQDSQCDQFTLVVSNWCHDCKCEWTETTSTEITKSGQINERVAG